MATLRVMAAATAIAFLGACANPAPSSFVPSAGSGLVQSGRTAPAVQSAGGGRVLYIANLGGSQPGVGSILVYTASMTNPQLIRTISNGTGRPIGLWVDSKNDLWVANQYDKYPDNVTAFKPGASSPFFTIPDTSFVGYPGSVAVDAHGNVWTNESDEDEGYVQEFGPGKTSANLTLDTGVGGYAFDPGSLAFDPQGNLYAAESAKLQTQIVELARGSKQFVPVNLDLNGNNVNGTGMGIDKAGNIYVASSEAGTIAVFPPGQSEPSRTISPVEAYGLTWVTGDGAVYQSSGESDVYEIAPGASSPTYTLGCECQTLGVAVSR